MQERKKTREWHVASVANFPNEKQKNEMKMVVWDVGFNIHESYYEKNYKIKKSYTKVIYF
jgi:hypothetical protein